MRIGIFGGTFNPVHIGHLRVAEEVRESLGLGNLVFVPSYLPPHKGLASDVPAEKRLEAVRIAIESNPYFTVSSYEVEQGGNSYSIRTIEHLRQEYGCTPYFILGRDAFNEISSWYEADRLFDLSHFVVMARPDAGALPLEQVLKHNASRFREQGTGRFINDCGNEIIFQQVTAYAVSSTKIRELCRQGRSIRYLVPEKVYDYISREGMYA
jgi:nicotinate-nucleotide adenylyltransferase